MSPATDQELAALMLRLTGLDLRSADGRAGAGAILRKIESKAPGTLTRMQAAVDIHRSAQRSRPGHA